MTNKSDMEGEHSGINSRAILKCSSYHGQLLTDPLGITYS